MDQRRDQHHRALLVTVLAVLMVLVVASPAGAHGADGSTKAIDLSQQAIAYLVSELSFWILLLTAVLATGGLSWSLTASTGVLVGVCFALSALVLVAAIALDLRILMAFERRRVR